MHNATHPEHLEVLPVSRYVALLILTPICGIISGMFWLFPNGLMAGAMAFCYSVGTLWLAERERKNPGSVGWAEALVAGLISGVLAVLPVGFLEGLRPPPAGGELDFLRPPALATWYCISAPILFGLVMHLSYHLRKGARYPRTKVLFTAFLLAGVVRLSLGLINEWTLGRSVSFHAPGQMIVSGFLFALVMVMPFPLLWVLVTSWFDPAWKVGPLQNAREECEMNASTDAVARADQNQ